MKKLTAIFVFVLAIFSTILISSSIFAEENMTWDRESFIDGNGLNAARYSLELAGASCRINIYENGMLEAIGNDYNFNGWIVTDLVILQINDGITRMQRYTGSTRLNPNNYYEFSVEGGYAVFYVKCVPYATSLPPEIQEKFNGLLGIK
jgi:hypothetical protein